MKAHTIMVALLLLLTSGWAGCASLNRFVFKANDVIDSVILVPVTAVYTLAVPPPLRKGITNFFSNLGSADVIVNDLLQGKLRQGARDGLRFLVNSTAGIGGLFDVATGIGLAEHDEDFGQTLGVWGVDPGPYLVLPLLGPSTVRDAPGLLVTTVLNPIFYIDDDTITIPLRIISAIDQRARASGALKSRDESALDPYVFTREAYLQRRRFLVYDGSPPEQPVTGDLDQDLEEALDEEDSKDAQDGK